MSTLGNNFNCCTAPGKSLTVDSAPFPPLESDPPTYIILKVILVITVKESLYYDQFVLTEFALAEVSCSPTNRCQNDVTCGKMDIKFIP